MDIISKFLKLGGKTAPSAGNTLIALSDPLARRTLRQALAKTVATNVIEADNKQSFNRAVTFNEIDVIIADADLKGWSSAHTIEQIRFGRMHCHAFPIVVMLTDDRRSVYDCGADLVLPAGAPAQAVAGQLESLSKGRKPFVVAPRYIGPERRSGERQTRSRATQLPVPNPLSMRTGGGKEQEYRRQLELAAGNISQIRRGFDDVRRSMPPRV